MTETLKIIKNRYSCCAYTNQLVEREKIEAIAKAALQALSALNVNLTENEAVHLQELYMPHKIIDAI